MKRVIVRWTVLTIVLAATATAALAQSRSLPTFEVDKSWPKVPAQWKLGNASSVAVDGKDNVWVLHRRLTLKPEDASKAAPSVLIFDTAGNFVKAWGGPAKGYEWPVREHGIYIDDKGFVWIGGNNCPEHELEPVNDDQLLKFTQDGKFVMQIGHSNQSKGNADTKNLHRPSDVAIFPGTNELFVADGYGNHRIVVFDANTGAFKRMWGAFGNKPVDNDHCRSNEFSEAINKKFTDPGPDQFSVVHAIRIAKDGTVYVADREYRRVQVYTKDGKFIKQVVRTDIPFAHTLALSTDPNQQFLYVGGDEGIFILDRRTLEILGKIQPPGLSGLGHFMDVDSKGNIYVAHNAKGLQKLTFKGMASVPAASTGPQMPRFANGKPDFNGLWARPRVNDVMKDMRGTECGSGKSGCAHKGSGDVEMTALGKQIMNDPSFDYTAFCLPAGYMRTLHSDGPVEIIQTPERLALLFEFNTVFKVVPTDGRKHAENLEPSWLGQSIGWYEGDTLVIDTIGYNGRTRLETDADHPTSDAMHTVERYHYLDPDHVAYDLTIEDPKMYTAPIKNSRVFVRMKGDELMESFCNENNKDLLEGHLQHMINDEAYKKYFGLQ